MFQWRGLSAHIDLLLGLWTVASGHCYPSQQHLPAILFLRSIRLGTQWMTQHIEVMTKDELRQNRCHMLSNEVYIVLVILGIVHLQKR